MEVCDPANSLIHNVVENGASQRMRFGILMGHFLVNLSLVILILQKLLALGKLAFMFNTLIATKNYAWTIMNSKLRSIYNFFILGSSLPFGFCIA